MKPIGPQTEAGPAVVPTTEAEAAFAAFRSQLAEPGDTDASETARAGARAVIPIFAAELAFWKRRADEVLRRAHAAESERDDLREELRLLKEARHG